MIPRLAALSIAEINPRICSALGLCVERTCFCMVRKRVTTLRLRSDRFNVWRARLVADLVLAIIDQKKIMEQSARRAEAEGYMRLPNASFAFSRSAASVPPIRICSTLSVPDADVGSGCGC